MLGKFTVSDLLFTHLLQGKFTVSDLVLVNYKKILKIRRDQPGIFNYNFDKSKIKKVTFVDRFQIGTCMDMFNGFRDLEVIENIENLDTSRVIEMCAMFMDCYSLQALDLNSLNTSKTADMECMFTRCFNLQSLKISQWNTSNLEDMYFMFDNCHDLTALELSNWSFNYIKTFSSMFSDCTSLTTIGDVSKWDVRGCGSLGDFEAMFYNCPNLKVDCSKWKVRQGVGHKWFCTKSPGVIEPNWTD